MDRQLVESLIRMAINRRGLTRDEDFTCINKKDLI